MELSPTTKAFAALAHDTRHAVVRLLVPAGPDGLAAGVIAERLDLPPNSLSFHLGKLTNAGLVHVRRAGRYLYYAANYPLLAELVGYLANDCCADAPVGCMPYCPPIINPTDTPCTPPRGRRQK